MTTEHHLKDKPKTLQHRAKIAASRRVSQAEDPEQWQAEYELALDILKRRSNLNKRFGEPLTN